MDQNTENHMPRSAVGEGLVKRNSRRVRMPGIVGDLADGNAIVVGKVGNISKTGFNFTDVSPDFRADKHVYTIVLSRGQNHYRVMAKPCWQRQAEREQSEFGFKILNAPWEWVEFTMTEIQEFDYDDSVILQA